MVTKAYDWSFCDTGAQTGQRNMDMDVSLARMVGTGHLPPTIRVYTWDPYCISLGKNQKNSEIDASKCSRDGIDVVQRPTGGRAVLHAEELTYSVVAPIAFGADALFESISRALVSAMQTLGIPAQCEAHPANLKSWYANSASTLCFSSSTRREIQVGGRKLIGSAQRIMGGAILQHGSILMGEFHKRIVDYLLATPEERASMAEILGSKTTCLAEWSDCDKSSLQLALREAFGRQFGVVMQEIELKEPICEVVSGVR